MEMIARAQDPSFFTLFHYFFLVVCISLLYNKAHGWQEDTQKHFLPEISTKREKEEKKIKTVFMLIVSSFNRLIFLFFSYMYVCMYAKGNDDGR
jgi:hypothetical protein